tara:strand:- start:223 stop:450 length:228 start_codon:yes stop_codon:yes gene_type:complete
MNIISTDDKELARDLNSKALINKNMAGLVEYNQRKNIILNKMKQEEQTQSRLERLESDMTEIKNMLCEIASHRNK